MFQSQMVAPVKYRSSQLWVQSLSTKFSLYYLWAIERIPSKHDYKSNHLVKTDINFRWKTEKYIFRIYSLLKDLKEYLE